MIVYAWLTTFLWHEFFHIKSQGLLNTGRINVYKSGFTATVDNKTNPEWCRLAGGFLSGILHFIIGGILWYHKLWYMYIPIITLAIINFTYGFWEMNHGGDGRYKVYGATTIVMILFWLAYWKLIGL